jgi:hypothetical protein
VKDSTKAFAWASALGAIATLFFVYLLIGFDLLVSWGSKSIDQLPFLFWVIFILMVVSWITMAVSNWQLECRKGDAPASSTGGGMLRITVFLIVSTIILLFSGPFELEWNGTNLALVTVALLVLLQFGLILVVRFRAKG